MPDIKESNKQKAVKNETKDYVLKGDYPPMKKGQKIPLTEEGRVFMKSQNLI